MSRRPGYNLEDALRRLHLPTIRRLHATLAEEAEKDGWTFREYLEHLVSEEIAHRSETRVTRSMRKAKFPSVLQRSCQRRMRLDPVDAVGRPERARKRSTPGKLRRGELCCRLRTERLVFGAWRTSPVIVDRNRSRRGYSSPGHGSTSGPRVRVTATTLHDGALCTGTRHALRSRRAGHPRTATLERPPSNGHPGP